MSTKTINKLSHFEFIKALKSISLSHFHFDNMDKWYATARLMADLVEADVTTVFTGIVQYKLAAFNAHVVEKTGIIAQFLTQLWLAADRDQYQDIVNFLMFHEYNADYSLLWDTNDSKLSLFPVAADDDQF